jgi:hypothetical protein
MKTKLFKQSFLMALLFTLASTVIGNAQIWTEKSTGFDTNATMAQYLSIANSNVIWTCSGSVNQFSKSIDGGSTWTVGTFGLPTSFSVTGITSISAAKAWICGVDFSIQSNTGVYVTVNGGTTWTKQPTALFDDLIYSFPDNIRFFDDNNGIVQGDPITGASFEIYRTSDGGATWVRVPYANLPAYQSGEYGITGYFDATTDGSAIWFGSTDGTTNRLYKSFDYGITWTATSLNLNSPKYSFTFKNASVGYLVGRVAGILTTLKTTDGGATFTAISGASGLPTTMIGYPVVKNIPNTTTLIYSDRGRASGGTYYNNNPDTEVWHQFGNQTKSINSLAFANANIGFGGTTNDSSTLGGIYKYSSFPVISLVSDGSNQSTQFSGWHNNFGNYDYPMTTTDGVNYTISSVFLTGAPGAAGYSSPYWVKFRQDNSWVTNWGNSSFPSGTGVHNGENICAFSPGNYSVDFNIETGAYVFTLLSPPPVVSIIGGSIGTPWTTDVDLTETDGVNYSLSNYNLTEGELKFRQDHNWSINWGGNSFPSGTGIGYGNNILASPSGAYTISFNRTTHEYSFVPYVALPDVNLAQSFCSPATVADLIATGTAIQWYTAATGGTALLSDTVLTTGTYYVSQTVNGIVSSKASVSVTVNSNAITVQPVTTPICKLTGATATLSVEASASSLPVYKWYSQVATSSTAAWVLLSDTTNYTGTGSAALSIIRSSATVPATGTKYKVEVSGNGCTTVTSDVVMIQDQTVLSKVAAISAVTKLTPALTTCEGTSVDLKLAAGSVGNIQWQSSTDNFNWTNEGSVVPQTTLSVANGILYFTTGVLTQDTWFRVVASNGACNSVSSTAVFKITVSTTPDAGTISGGDVTVCAPLASGLDVTGTTTSFGNSTTLNLDGTNLGVTVVWQKSINYTATIPTWSTVANTTTVNNAYSGASSTALSIVNLTASTWYRAKITNGACVVYTDVVKITVSSAAKAGAITCPTSVCSGGDIQFTSAAYTGTSLQWEVSTLSATTGFAALDGETGFVFNMNNVTNAPLSKFYVRTVVTSGDCTMARSAVKTVLVNPTSVAGTVTGGGTVCSSGIAGTLKLAGNIGTIQWQYSTDGTNYTDAPSATVGTAVTFTTTSATSKAATYIVSNVTSDTYFRAVVTSGACSSLISNAVQYVVGTAAVAGTATAGVGEVCPAFGTTITLEGSTGAIAWKKSTNWLAAIPTWSAVTTSVTSTLSTGNLTASTAYKAVVTIGSCSTVESNVVVIIVTAKPVSKGITANVTSPAGAATTPLCTSSSSKVLTVTAGYVGSIQWQSSTATATTGFTDISGATATTYVISGASVGANFFRAKFINSCGVEVFSPALTIYYKDCTPAAKTEAPFGVVVYPNPSSDNFNLNLTTSSEEKVGILIYDVTGKQIDKQEVNPSEISELQIGREYPSGVYNMIVTQGENIKTMRIIKR